MQLTSGRQAGCLMCVMLPWNAAAVSAHLGVQLLLEGCAALAAGSCLVQGCSLPGLRHLQPRPAAIFSIQLACSRSEKTKEKNICAKPEQVSFSFADHGGRW